MNKYKYRPVKFYFLVFIFTWGFWFAPFIIFGRTALENPITALFGLVGLFVPSAVAIIMVLGFKNAALKKDLKDKLFGLFRLNQFNICISIVSFFIVIVISIFASTLFGQSLKQFSIVDFSFSIGGTSAILTIIAASLLEELGWRGYGEDSIANYCSWWKESLIFGLVWGIWHVPLIFVPGTYYYGIFNENPLFMLNFLLSLMPLGFIVTWVYVTNKRSILANMIFHLFVNFMQEKIGMMQITKCVQTFILYIAAGIIVYLNRELFFEKDHIGNLLQEKEAGVIGYG
jgi:membrane protease YdiL (CAAX protease family)